MSIDWDWFIQSDIGQTLIGIVVVSLAILFFDRVFKTVLKKALSAITNKHENWVFYFLRDQKLIFWILSIPYLTIIHEGIKWIHNIPDNIIVATERIVTASYILVSLFIFANALRIVNEIYNQSLISRARPIKGYLQSVQIVAYFFGFILILAVLLNKSPLIFVSGLGAMTAILLLVFKDTILSLVAGVQLTSNDLIRVGDWIEMPQFNADGDVIEIALHSVKVQNWDRTISVIPAYKFSENSFKNWRGMQDSGGRRVKRSLFIDVNSIRFLEASDVQRLSKIKLLKEYLATKTDEIGKYNQTFDGEFLDSQVNLRRLTNVGTYRAYISQYLKNHPKVHSEMTNIVRHLETKSEGLPIEVYFFTNDTRWNVYEDIQADIFDHMFAILPEFGLRAYQQQSGNDFKNIAESSPKIFSSEKMI